LGKAGGLRTRFDGTYLKNLITTTTSGSWDCAGLFGPSCQPATPKWRNRLTLDWDTPITALSAGLTWRHYNSVQNSFTSPSVPNDYIPPASLPAPLADARLPSMDYLDLHASWSWNKVVLRVGVNNVMDKDPPFMDVQTSGGNTIFAESNTNPSLYDTLGRQFYFNITADF
jgi:outer membrane receptor for ferrienterochelin and colicin